MSVSGGETEVAGRGQNDAIDPGAVIAVSDFAMMHNTAVVSRHRGSAPFWAAHSKFGSILIEVNGRAQAVIYDKHSFIAQKECCTWECLTSYSPVGNARKSTAISLIDTNKGTPPRATPIKRFLKRYGEVSHAVPPDQYAQAA